MNEASWSFSRKKCTAVEKIEQNTGGTDATSSLSVSNGEISVMWASSQGGCDPLNKLLRNVQKSHLPPPSQCPSFISPFPPSFSGAISLVEEPSQASCSKASPSCFGSSGAPVLSDHTSTCRPAKRTRSSLSRGNNKIQNVSSSPSLSWVSKTKLANPSSNALSRISRSLNQKMVSKCTSSPQLRMQQTQRSERSSSQPHSSRMHVAPNLRPKAGSLNRQPEVLHSAHPVCKRATIAPSPSIPTAQAELHMPTITNSPRKARIKALLETIDHAGPFPGQASSSSSFTTPGGDKPVNPSRLTIRIDREHENQPHPPQLRKILALGMRCATPLQPAYSNTLPQSHTANTVFKQPSISQSSVANLEGGMVQSTTSPSSMLHTDSSHPSDLGQMMGMHMRLHHNETRASQVATRRRSKTKGYRSSDPCSATLYKSGPPLVSDDNLEIIKDDGCDLAPIARSTRLCANTEHLSLTPRIIPIPGEDDAEFNTSSDGASSSSYGDIDIDPTALEDVCKAYDA